MKIGIILETNDPEKAWNGVRFANTAQTQGHTVKLFLMSAGVEAESIADERFNVKEQLYTFVDNHGEVLACGTCLKVRNLSGTKACPMSTMMDCLTVVEWADKMITF
ncbi:MAG TPA: DsrE family protein [Moraxellaceae bacterium]|nr:DsrE family protein [Moraxellaceae bacterium]